MAIIRRKVFVGPTVYFGFKGLNYYRDKVRDAAEAFINEEIRPERLVSVSEHVTSNGPFSVAVWFRADGNACPSESRVMSNADLRRQDRGFEVKPQPEIENMMPADPPDEPLKAKLLRRRVAKLVVGFLTVIVLYVGLYVLLTINGGYFWSQSGNYRYSFGLAVTDVEIWHPRWAYWEPFKDVSGRETSRGNALGYAYSPLIRIDRALFHPTKRIFEQSSSIAGKT